MSSYSFSVLFSSLSLAMFAPPVATQSSPLTVVSATDMQRDAISLTRVAQTAKSPAPRLKVEMPNITVEFRSTLLSDALRDVARSSNVRLVYASDLLPKNKRVSLNAVDVPVLDVVQTLLLETGLRAKVEPNGRITIVPDMTEPAQGKGRIRGTIIMSTTKQPVRDATVFIEGTTLSTTTNRDGEFSFTDIEEGTYSLNIRSIGYVRQVAKVTVGPEGAAAITVTLEPSASQLDPVVVTSGFREASPRETPVVTTVITADEIQRRNITRVDQLLRISVPGIYMPDLGPASRNPGQPTEFTAQTTPQVRGQNFLSAGETTPGSLKIYVDGMEVTGYDILSQLNMDRVERFEVMAGPSATAIYGSGASDGVIHIITKQGVLGNKAEWTIRAASDFYSSPYKESPVANWNAKVSMMGGSNEVRYSVSAGLEHDGAWIPDYSETSRTVGATINWIYSSKLDLSLSADYTGPNKYKIANSAFLAEGLLDGRFSRAKVPTSALVPANTGTSVDDTRINSRIVYRPFMNWTHELAVGANMNTIKNLSFAPAFKTIDDTLLSRQTTDARVNTIRYTVTWNTGSRERISSVINATIDYADRKNQYVNAVNLQWPHADNYAAYVSLRPTRTTGYAFSGDIGLYDRVFVHPSLRIERSPAYGSDVFGEVTPNLGVSVPLAFGDNELRLRASYGTGTRPPEESMTKGSNVSGYLSGEFYNGTQYLANPELRAAKQSGFEYTAELFLGDLVYFMGRAYVQKSFDDLFSTTVRRDTTEARPGDPFRFFDLTQIQWLNIGETKTHGVDLRGVLTWNAWRVQSNYSTWSNIIKAIPPDAGITATYGSALQPGDRNPNSPTYTWYTVFEYSNNRFTGNLEVNSRGRVQMSDQLDALNRTFGSAEYEGPSRPGRSILAGKKTDYNLNATYRLTPRTLLNLGIQNVLNNRRFEGMDTRTPVIGRTTLLGISHQFFQ